MQGFFKRYLGVYRPLITRLNELLAGYDLSYSLWQVIVYVENNGPATLVDISSHYNVEKPTITRRVQRLEESKLVKQIASKDRREKIIQLTKLGEEVYKACRKDITELEKSVMEGIPLEERVAIFEILPKIQENIMNRGEGQNE
ncbi:MULTISPECIES: MarR family winged helix-turn-helix transcriptional regulator [Metabacillus]|uniref:MarR family transcriptional regulator n=1 Tax=Metabacillus rhizolycopersici TaxID=2875709 RepID=A0ABS7UVF9_9BACI|nr:MULTISPECIES: MarR family transcriptional regulator [Metabacillus]MBZ5752224.1 MarR family transcriptional regulator [Metabacillus rhizolycopersici]MCM3650841.1 MarR family transcriptional regulator [Metabacillus litoralis]